LAYTGPSDSFQPGPPAVRLVRPRRLLLDSAPAPGARTRPMTLTDWVRRFPHISERAVLASLLILFAAVSVQYTVKTLDARDGKQDRSAILRWREQLLLLDGGENIYATHNYPNPPIMALLLRPL